MFSDCIQKTSDGVVLIVQVQPRAAKTEYVGLYGSTALKFRVDAPPVDGKANEALCRFLAKQLGIAKSSVVLAAGAGSRHKRVLLKGLSIEQVIRSLGVSEEG